MEKKDFDIPNVEEISFIDCEEMASTALSVKEEMYSEESSEVNVCAPDNIIDTVLINSNASVPYSFEEKGKECMNDSGPSFCFVGIKMEEPDDYESESESFTNSETKYSSVIYPSNHERECNVDDQYLEGTLSNTSCIKLKMECEEDFTNCKSDFQTNDVSVTIDMNKKCDIRSVVRGCDMGHSSNEFIRGIECQEYPILRVKEEKEEDKSIAVNKRNSVTIKEKENQNDLTSSSSADLEYNTEEYPYNREYTNMEGSFMEGNEFPIESSIKMESKEEICVSKLKCLSTEIIYMNKTLESNPVTTIHPVDSETKSSSDGKSRCVKEEVRKGPGRNNVQIYRNTTFDETLMKDHCEDSRVDRSEGLEIQFESICDASEFDIEAEKPFGSGLNSENVGELDDKPPICEPLSVILKDEPVELESMSENQVTKNSSNDVIPRRVMLKDVNVVLENVSSQGVYPSHQTEIRKEASAFRGNSCSLDIEEKKEFNKIFEEQEMLRSEQCVTVYSPENNYKGKYNISIEKGFSIRQPSFVESKDLKQVTHFHTSENLFSCFICDKYFQDKKHLKEHIRTHSAGKLFSCKVCKVGFTFMSKLQIHMRCHTGERPFSCEVCNSTFSVKGALKIHMRTHTGEKPFSCDLCQSSFTVKCHLKRHMLTHTGEKPFFCNICESFFSQKNNLNQHMLTHSGLKPISCDICYASFSQKSNLNRHMRTHAGEKRFT